MNIPVYLRKVVDTLSKEIGVRTYRDPHRLEKAASFITGEFSSFGYGVVDQQVPYRGKTYRNVIAERTGLMSSERIMIVGAHYDSVRTTPGADDNASGVAGLLALAGLLSQRKLSRTVRFAAFTLEEPPAYRSKNMGSYHYARSLKEKNEAVAGMICLEMIGYYRDHAGSQHYPLPFFTLKFPNKGNYIAMVGNRRSKKFTEEIAENFRKGTDLPLVTLNAPPFIVGIDFSDHWSFNKFGFRALMVTDTAFYRNPHYHAPTDLPETLDYDRMTNVVEGLTRAVEAWGKSR